MAVLKRTNHRNKQSAIKANATLKRFAKQCFELERGCLQKLTAASKLWSQPAVLGVVCTVELWISMADCTYPWVAEVWSIEENPAWLGTDDYDAFTWVFVLYVG